MSSSESDIDEESHSAALKKLETTDPEFYKYLKENDQKLLDYHDSDEEEEHLEESECQEEPDQVSETQELSPAEIETLKDELNSSPTVENCKQAMCMLKSCIGNIDDKEQLSILNGNLFNDVMRLCLVDLIPALSVALKLPQQTGVHSLDPSKSKNWKKISTSMKSYLIDVVKLSSVVNEPSTLQLILKHMMRLVPYFIQFIKLSRLLIKKMIIVWSTSVEKARILAFMVIFRTLKRIPNEYHPQVLKHIYFAFVRNTKFSTVSTLPLISFMRRSLTELYSYHPQIAYEHTFLYLRQLCIHLRNALTTKKKEAFQTVYNWQYVHCILLWSEVVCSLYDYEPIKTLMYPLIQLITGTINMIPTLRYAPLRFHLIKNLIMISSVTKVFIPVPPLLLEALGFIDSEKKTTFSKKVVNLDCALKASKSELQESGYRDSIVTEVCKLLSEYFDIYAASISFPDLAFLTILQLKAFLKKNKIGTYGQKIKAVVDNLQQNSNFISERRNNVTFQITDVDEIEKWEKSLLLSGTPLLKAKQKQIVKKDEVQEPPKKKIKKK